MTDINRLRAPSPGPSPLILGLGIPLFRPQTLLSILSVPDAGDQADVAGILELALQAHEK